jgi:hypothetical protein
MNTQTERPARKPTNQQGKAARNSKRYHKQTAHVEARRDGKPLIFGWGTHLSHTEKVRLQRRGVWGLAVIVVLILVGVIVSNWIDLNIIIPGLAITTVNGHAIPQSEYRTMLAVQTQLELNKLYGPNGLTTQLTHLQTQDAQQNAIISQSNTQIADLNKQIKALPAGPSTQRTNLQSQLDAENKTLTAAQAADKTLQSQINDLTTNQITLEKQNFTQPQLSNESATWLQDDEMIREWLITQSPSLQAKINPTASQVNNDFNSLKKNMPTSNGYNTLLSSMGISDSDVRAMLTIVDRRNNLQNYLSPQINSPSYQVLSRQMVIPTQQKANHMLQDLQKGQDFGVLAKANSQDPNTTPKGGDLGWLTRYQYIDAAGNINGSPIIDNWLFDPARKLNDISPVLFANSAYYIVQITNVDPSRAIDPTLLKALQSNALINWLQDLRYLSSQHIIATNQTMMADPNNLPPNNILPSTAPGVVPTPTPAGL